VRGAWRKNNFQGSTKVPFSLASSSPASTDRCFETFLPRFFKADLLSVGDPCATRAFFALPDTVDQAIKQKKKSTWTTAATFTSRVGSCPAPGSVRRGSHLTTISGALSSSGGHTMDEAISMSAAGQPFDSSDIKNKRSVLFRQATALVEDLGTRPGASWFLPRVDRREMVGALK